MNIIKELKENLIEDFEDYMKEEKKEISNNWIANEIYINNYLESIVYFIQDNTKTSEEAEEIAEEFYNILDDYCCRNTIPLF